MEKTAVFPGGYGRIGEIPHGRLRPDWGLKGYMTDVYYRSLVKGKYDLSFDV